MFWNSEKHNFLFPLNLVTVLLIFSAMWHIEKLRKIITSFWSVQICVLIYQSLLYLFSNAKRSALLELFRVAARHRICDPCLPFLTSPFSLIYPFEADRGQILEYSRWKFIICLYGSPFFKRISLHSPFFISYRTCLQKTTHN